MYKLNSKQSKEVYWVLIKNGFFKSEINKNPSFKKKLLNALKTIEISDVEYINIFFEKVNDVNEFYSLVYILHHIIRDENILSWKNIQAFISYKENQTETYNYIYFIEDSIIQYIKTKSY